MKASADCIEYWNGWFRQVKKGESLNQRGMIISNPPANVVWNGALGRLNSR